MKPKSRDDYPIVRIKDVPFLEVPGTDCSLCRFDGTYYRGDVQSAYPKCNDTPACVDVVFIEDTAEAWDQYLIDHTIRALEG